MFAINTTTVSDAVKAQIVDQVSGMFPGLNVRVNNLNCWVSGDTKPRRLELRSAGFKWAKARKEWFKRVEDFTFETTAESMPETAEEIAEEYITELPKLLYVDGEFFGTFTRYVVNKNFVEYYTDNGVYTVFTDGVEIEERACVYITHKELTAEEIAEEERQIAEEIAPEAEEEAGDNTPAESDYTIVGKSADGKPVVIAECHHEDLTVPAVDKHSTLETLVKDWYLDAYASDTLGEELNDKITFKDIAESIPAGTVYETLGVGDSVIRERVFAELADVLGVGYGVLSDAWSNKTPLLNEPEPKPEAEGHVFTYKSGRKTYCITEGMTIVKVGAKFYTAAGRKIDNIYADPDCTTVVPLKWWERLFNVSEDPTLFA